MAWAVGQIVGNEYTIDRKLGEGGFGITYRAVRQNGQRVVIKTLNDMVQRDPNFTKLQEDFLNEALRLAKCPHPHIAKVERVFQEGRLWCMVMEYIDGGNLGDRVIQSGVLTENEALIYIQQIGEALAVVHQQGLLHRDIKPFNIMLRSGHKEAVLIDFGIAREFTPNLTQTHTLGFTEGYAPIEQYYQRYKRGAYTDVYALAATLYSLLTGDVPVSALNREHGVKLKPPKQLNPKISNQTNQAILKGMAIKPQSRPQSMGDWLKMLGIATVPASSKKIPKSKPSHFIPLAILTPFFIALYLLNNSVQELKRSLSTAPVVSPTLTPLQIPTPEPSQGTPPSQPQVSPPLEDDFKSERGVDYTKLRDLLNTEDWQAAQQETYLRMADATGSSSGAINYENLNCTDFRTIDQLWSKYSVGRFGFSVQWNILNDVSISPSEVSFDTPIEKWRAYGDRVGWRVNGNWISSPQQSLSNNSIPTGHFPWYYSSEVNVGQLCYNDICTTRWRWYSDFREIIQLMDKCLPPNSGGSL